MYNFGDIKAYFVIQHDYTYSIWMGFSPFILLFRFKNSILAIKSVGSTKVVTPVATNTKMYKMQFTVSIVV